MSSGFISESDIAERKRLRQLEWEKVRQPDQPLEAPEEDYDHRTLFERLEEQRKLKELEYEETHRLSSSLLNRRLRHRRIEWIREIYLKRDNFENMVKGLDDDEVEFLEMVDRTKMEEERKLLNEEKQELQRFRNRVATLEERSESQRIVEEIKPLVNAAKSTSSKLSQRKLLAGAVVKKRPANESNATPNKNPILIENEKSSDLQNGKHHQSSDNETSKNSSTDNTDGIPKKRAKISNSEDENESNEKTEKNAHSVILPSARKCVAILPSLYPTSSSSDENADSSDESPIEDYLTPMKAWALKIKASETREEE